MSNLLNYIKEQRKAQPFPVQQAVTASPLPPAQNTTPLAGYIKEQRKSRQMGGDNSQPKNLNTLGAFGQALVTGVRSSFENMGNAADYGSIANNQMADMEKRLQGIDITNPQAVSDVMKNNYRQTGIESEYARQVQRKIQANTQAQGERLANIRQKYRDAPLVDIAINAGYGVGNMLPAVAIGGVSAPAYGSAAFAVNTFGDYLGEALLNDADLSQAGQYASASAAVETGLEAIAGGIPFLGDGKISAKGFTDKYIKTAAGQFLVNKRVDIAGEGFEEAASEVIQPFIRRAFYDKNAANASTSDILTAAGNGALVSAILGVANIGGNMKEYKAIKEKNLQKAAMYNFDKGSYMPSNEQKRSLDILSDMLDLTRGNIRTAEVDMYGDMLVEFEREGKTEYAVISPSGRATYPQDIGKSDKYTNDYYTEWIKSLGAEKTLPKTLENFYLERYNNTPAYKLINQYVRDVDSGWVSAISGFDNYSEIHSQIEKEIVGKTIADGIKINGQTQHFMQRVIGTGQDPKKYREDLRIIRRSGVPVEYIEEALFNPKNIGPVLTSPSGKRSIRYSSDKCDVVINPDTGMLIQTNLTD